EICTSVCGARETVSVSAQPTRKSTGRTTKVSRPSHEDSRRIRVPSDAGAKNIRGRRLGGTGLAPRTGDPPTLGRQIGGMELPRGRVWSPAVRLPARVSPRASWLRAERLRSKQPEALTRRHRLEPSVHGQLRKEAPYVVADSLGRDSQLSGDLGCR